MAKKLKELPAGTRSRYPWDDWFDGEVWELTEGEDYTVSTDNMRTAVHSAAKTRGGKATTTSVEGGLAIQYHEGDGKPAARKTTAKKAPAKKPATKSAAVRKKVAAKRATKK